MYRILHRDGNAHTPITLDTFKTRKSARKKLAEVTDTYLNYCGFPALKATKDKLVTAQIEGNRVKVRTYTWIDKMHGTRERDKRRRARRKEAVNV